MLPSHSTRVIQKFTGPPYFLPAVFQLEFGDGDHGKRCYPGQIVFQPFKGIQSADLQPSVQVFSQRVCGVLFRCGPRTGESPALSSQNSQPGGTPVIFVPDHEMPRVTSHATNASLQARLSSNMIKQTEIKCTTISQHILCKCEQRHFWLFALKTKKKKKPL